jgi:DNA-binding NarL/FixJ family response regulator
MPVLVIDDEADIRELIALELSLEGFDVITAGDGADGLALARSEAPEVIVLDLMMPGIDGWEVLRRLKADSELAGVPVVILSARTAEIDRVRGGIEGAVSYLTKPFDVDALRDAIEDALSGVPEPELRHAAQQKALSALARLETPEPSDPGDARPRLSRLDGERPAATRPATVPAAKLSGLSSKQRELIEAVATLPSIRDVAEKLDVSRSNIYASLRRIARKLDVGSVAELIAVARRGGLH